MASLRSSLTNALVRVLIRLTTTADTSVNDFRNRFARMDIRKRGKTGPCIGVEDITAPLPGRWLKTIFCPALFRDPAPAP